MLTMGEALRTSEYRIEKARTDAVLVLANGETARGQFFVGVYGRSSAPERVAELLNGEAGFFPFEVHSPDGPRTVLYNRLQIMTVMLADEEARLDPGYDVATPRAITVHLMNNQRLTGWIRIHRPEGRDRLSDWTRQPELFRYVETDSATYLVNMAHVVDVTELAEVPPS